MILRTVLAAGAALLLAPAAAAQAPQAAAQQQDKATLLADLLGGPEVGLPLDMALSKRGFYAGFESEDEEMLKEHPGLVDTLWAAVEPAVRREALENNAVFVGALAAMFRARLTAKELDGVHAFYSSETGASFLRALAAGPEAAPANPAETRVNPGDKQAFAALAASIKFDKFQQVGADMQKLKMEHWAKKDPEFDARIEAIVEETLQKYMDAQGKQG